MKAVILAAGIGKRLQPITFEYPKAMVRVKGKPILEKLVKDLVSCGVKEIIVVVGYMHEQIESYFGDGSGFRAKISYAMQSEQLGTGHAVLQTEGFFNPQDKDFILLFGDNWMKAGAIKKVMAVRPGIGVIGARHVPDPKRFGIIEPDGMRVKSVIEKPENPPSDLAVLGVLRLPTSIFRVLKSIPKSERGEYELPHAYRALIAEGVPFEWVDIGQCVDIGTKQDLEKVNW